MENQAKSCEIQVDRQMHPNVDVNPGTKLNSCVMTNPNQVRYVLDLSGLDGKNGARGGEQLPLPNQANNNGEDGYPGQNAFSGSFLISGSINHLSIQVGEDINRFLLDRNEIVLIRCVGGAGGNGGDGEDALREGLKGGDAGNGGNGGDGGNLIISTQNPVLLALIDIENRGGRGGLPGVPGRHSGSGQKGLDGLDGSVSFIVESSKKNILEKGACKFLGRILSMQFNDDCSNGVFEPGSELIIDNIEVVNDGDVTLPRGSILQVSCVSSSTHIVLPALSPGQHYNINKRPLHLPLPLAYTGDLPITASIILFDRIVGPDAQLHITLQYPIRFQNVCIPPALGPGERGSVIITAENVSPRSYGRNHRGRIDVEVQLGCLLRHSIDSSRDINLRSIRQRLSISTAIIQIVSIESGAHEIIKFEIEVVEEANKCLYAALPVQIRLFLNGASAETIRGEIGCIPNPMCDSPLIRADILLITTLTFCQLDYAFWNSVASELGLSLLTYNVDRDTLELNAAPDWLKRCRIVIAASNNDGDLLRFPSHYISQHLLNNPSAGVIITGKFDKYSLASFLIGTDYSAPVLNEKIIAWNFPNIEERVARKAIKQLQTGDGNYIYYAVVHEDEEGEFDSNLSCCGLRRELPKIGMYRSLFSKSSRVVALRMKMPAFCTQETVEPIAAESSSDPSGWISAMDGKSFSIASKQSIEQLHRHSAISIAALLEFLSLEEKIALLQSNDHEPRSERTLVTDRYKTNRNVQNSVADFALISLAYDLWRNSESEYNPEADLLTFVDNLSHRLFEGLTNVFENIQDAARIAFVFEPAIQRLRWRSCVPFRGRKRFEKRRRILQEAQTMAVGGHMSTSIRKHLRELSKMLPPDPSLFGIYSNVELPCRYRQTLLLRKRNRTLTDTYSSGISEQKFKKKEEQLLHPISAQIIPLLDEGKSSLGSSKYPPSLSREKESAATIFRLLKEGVEFEKIELT